MGPRQASVGAPLTVHVGFSDPCDHRGWCLSGVMLEELTLLLVRVRPPLIGIKISPGPQFS